VSTVIADSALITELTHDNIPKVEANPVIEVESTDFVTVPPMTHFTDTALL